MHLLGLLFHNERKKGWCTYSMLTNLIPSTKLSVQVYVWIGYMCVCFQLRQMSEQITLHSSHYGNRKFWPWKPSSAVRVEEGLRG